MFLQLNEYEIAPYFIQFSQFLTNCLMIFAFSTEFTRAEPRIVLNKTITCQVLAELNRIWSCLIFIKLYSSFFTN